MIAGEHHPVSGWRLSRASHAADDTPMILFPRSSRPQEPGFGRCGHARELLVGARALDIGGSQVVHSDKTRSPGALHLVMWPTKKPRLLWGASRASSARRCFQGIEVLSAEPDRANLLSFCGVPKRKPGGLPQRERGWIREASRTATSLGVRQKKKPRQLGQ